MPVNKNNPEPMRYYNVGLTDEEFTELITLIDEGEVDEELLAGIRKKLVQKRKNLRQRVVVGTDITACALPH